MSGISHADKRASAGDFTCRKHPGVVFVCYFDDGSWNPHPIEHWACPACLESFRAFCREISVRPKDRPLFHGLKASTEDHHEARPD